MNIRKHWKKILLTTTAFFWAGCHYEDDAQPLYGVYCPPEGCGEPELSSSSINPLSSSSEVVSSSSKTNTSSSSNEESSSSEVTCTPGDSTVSYYPPSYSADIAKMNAEERAKRSGVEKIDSVKKTLQTTPQCLENLRQELDMFVALYGAPNIFPKDEVCSDGTTRPTKEYLEYLKMKEEWEKNKPALDEECQKIYEEKLNDIQQRINKCLNISSHGTNPIECDLEAMCPEYGVDAKCSYNYNCKDGAYCRERDKDGTTLINCNDGSGNKVTYTEEEFKSIYHVKNDK